LGQFSKDNIITDAVRQCRLLRSGPHPLASPLDPNMEYFTNKLLY